MRLGLGRLLLVLSADQIHALQEAIAHQQAGRASKAVKIYERLIRKAPNDLQCVLSLALLQAQQGNFNAAIPLFRRAAAIRPDDLDIRYNLAVALSMAGEHQEAAQNYESILKSRPEHAAARNNYATTLLQSGRFADALTQYDEGVRRNPTVPEAYNNRGLALQGLKRFEDALRDYDKVIALRPNFPEAYVNRGNALANLRRPDDALAAFDKAIALRPDIADAYKNAGNIHSMCGSYKPALAAYDRALSLRPGDPEARSMRLSAKMHLCDWTDIETEWLELFAGVKRGLPIYPFVTVAASSSPEEQFQCARLFSKTNFPTAGRPVRHGQAYSHERIRVAYLSGDFREHAVTYLVAGLFERHDRSRFEVTGLSFGSDQESPLRNRITAAVEHFIDVRHSSDQDIADLIREREFDIVVDLMGYTQNARPGILALRPAPIQVGYLGFLGTMGADFIDYIIADRIALPFDQQRYFSEKIVHLPDCFLVNDDRLKIEPHTPSRGDAGLPTEGFVFCSFNNSYKLTRPMFELWMRLLHAVDGSVLWLAEANPDMALNLQRAAERCSIDTGRLVFAPRIPLAEHLARQRLADLFLDTTPYNAGATAAAALWSGVPVLTVLGKTFVGRMAASMLRAIGLPELVAKSLRDYETIASTIATDQAYCSSLKARLARNRETFPLFDSARSTRHIEAAYEAMWLASRQGRAPEQLEVKVEDQQWAPS